MNAKVSRDRWGVPHLRAGDPLALAYLQGVNAATDRAWQLELERRRFLGTSAAFFGPEAAGWDMFVRQARLADTARRCYEALDEPTKEWVDAYVAGVNHALPGAGLRAPEVGSTGITPERWEPWAPLGIWLAVHILFAGFPTKFWREQVASKLGADRVHLFSSEGHAVAGSNGWLVPGELTGTGSAIIAGDPHRWIESPGVYQQIRLSCPEYDVVGFAVPGVPGIPHFGHAGGVAWAITNAMADYQDLYEEQLRRTPEGIEALGPNGWARATSHTETVEVLGADPIEIEVIETDRGVVISPATPDEKQNTPTAPAGEIGGVGETSAADGVGAAGGVGGDAPAREGGGFRGISLRYVPRVTGKLGFEGFPKLLAATTVEDVDAAYETWVEPVNVVLAADTEGGLLHRTAGLVPRRQEQNRVRIVPAWSPEHAWDGWYEMPRDKVDGVAVMANARELSAGLGVEFASPHRSHRIRELLTEKTGWTVDEMPAIHTDTYLGSAGSILDLITGLGQLSGQTLALRNELLDWDRRMDADSTTAAAYAALRRALIVRIADHPEFAGLGPTAGYPELFDAWQDPLTLVSYGLDTLLTSDQLTGIDLPALAREALEEVANRKPRGPWGETHQLVPLHALRGPLFTPDEEPLDLGLSGDMHCVLATHSVAGLTDVCHRGSVARYAWDLADRSASSWVVPLGASGVLGDPHHHDQLASWVKGELLPIVTDWDELIPEIRDYEQVVDGFGMVRLREADPVADLDLIHGWVTAERARFWGMADLSREEIGQIYTFLDSVPTHHVYIASLDGEPVALVQTYDPQADPAGAAYPREPGDIGGHFLIAPGDPRPGFSSAILGVVGRYLLGELGHPRMIAEPDARNEKAINRLVAMGFTLGAVTTFTQHDGTPKTAQFAFLTRADFLGRQAIDR